MEDLPSAWIMKIATVLKDNFTMAEILSLTNTFGANHDIPIAYHVAPDFMNKQTVANKNISKFNSSQMILFLDELTEAKMGWLPEQIAQLAEEVVAKFGSDKIETASKINNRFKDYPDIMEIWGRAITCLSNNQYHEAVNNSRLALEKLLKSLFKNNKSLENQKSNIGISLEDTSAEFKNLFMSQLRSYEILQNEQFKHDYTPHLGTLEVRYILNTTFLMMDYIEKKYSE